MYPHVRQIEAPRRRTGHGRAPGGPLPAAQAALLVLASLLAVAAAVATYVLAA